LDTPSDPDLRKSTRSAYTRDVQYQAQKTGQVRPELKVHELKADNRAVCGNSRRQPMDDLGPGTVTCESCAGDTGHAD
jgi:hypothetical protein